MHAGGMGLVQQQHGVVASGQRDQFRQWRAVTVHGIERLHRDPHPAGPAARAPALDDRVHRLDIIVRSGNCLDAGRVQPVAEAGMDQRVVNDQVAGPRQGGGDCGIGGKAGWKIQRRLTAEETGGFFFQRLMLGMIAAQQPRAAGADGHAARQRRRRGIAQGTALRQAQEIVGGKVQPARRCQCAQPPPGGQRLQHGLMRIFHGAWIPQPPAKGKLTKRRRRSRPYARARRTASPG